MMINAPQRITHAPALSRSERQAIQAAPTDLLDIYVCLGQDVVAVGISGRIEDGKIVLPFVERADAVESLYDAVGVVSDWGIYGSS